MRNIIQQAKTKSLDSEYKIFIIDECHAISNAGWQAMLKIIEEPPAKSIFIFCTTDPQKIPKTILSRVQRYDFQRISQKGIVDRLFWILELEGYQDFAIDGNALEYIAKIADGGMRDAITLMDKCLAYSKDLTLEDVVKALGTTDYDTMFRLTDYLLQLNGEESTRLAVQLIEDIYNDGKDLKTFVKQYVQFLLDLSKWGIGCDWKYLTLPKLNDYETWLKDCGDREFNAISDWLSAFVNLNSDIKWSQSVKYDIEASIILESEGIS